MSARTSEEGRRHARSRRDGCRRVFLARPVRFLWQTDAADRFLFLSPGLAQVVGRNAEIVGERWQEASARLRLDPGGRIARALRQRDTWSGLTAWWPIEGSNVRVPVELTALPVFGGDQSFQGFRGFGILQARRGADAGDLRGALRSAAPLGEPQPPYEELLAANVVPIRADLERMADSAQPHDAGAERLRGDRRRAPRSDRRRARRQAGFRSGKGRGAPKRTARIEPSPKTRSDRRLPPSHPRA